MPEEYAKDRKYLRTRSRARGEGAYALHEEAQQILDDLNIRKYEGSERLCHAAVNKAKYQADIRLKRAGALCPQLSERYRGGEGAGVSLRVIVTNYSDSRDKKTILIPVGEPLPPPEKE